MCYDTYIVHNTNVVINKKKIQNIAVKELH